MPASHSHIHAHSARRAASTSAPPSADAGRAAHLAVNGVSQSYGSRRVLTDVSFTAAAGDRIGLIGENGSGKSTLLRIIGGLSDADSGAVRHAGSVGSLLQELPYPDDAPVHAVLDDAQHDALAARRRIETAGAALASTPEDASFAEAYAEALEEADRAGAWEAESRRGEVLTGLGLGGVPPATPIGELSGGQRLRLALAALLLEAPHTVLLDEPSNHLDAEAAGYLQQVLTAWPGIVVVASHDRTLLDAVATRIIDLDPVAVPAAVLADAERADAGEGNTGAVTTDDPGTGLGVRVWGTGYSAAREAQRAERSRWQQLYDAQQEEHDALIHEIEIGSREVNRKHESRSEVRASRKFYADKDARVTARRARNARVRLEQLERERVRRPPAPLHFSMADRAPVPRASANEPLLRVDGAALTDRLAPLSFALSPDEHLLLAGPNGAGKSTLLAMIAGELAPSEGRVHVAPGTRVGYLPQEVAFDAVDRSAEAAYAAAVGPDLAERRPLAESGLLAERDAAQPVGALSVGQRRRLALAIVLADPPPLLLLDEPSNHLSLTLVEELEAALRDYPGALVIATHDRWLRSRWRGRVQEFVPANS